MREYIMAMETDMDGVNCYIRKDELIRCKDCKYRDEQTGNCTRFRKDWYVQSNSFCSWAERRNDETN